MPVSWMPDAVPVDAGAPRVLWAFLAPLVTPQADRAWWEAEQTLVVQFNVAVKQVSPYAADDALNPLNYITGLLDGGVVQATILLVEPWTDALGVADPTRVRVHYSGVVVPRFRFSEITPSSIATMVGVVPIIDPATVLAEGVAPPVILSPAGITDDGVKDLRSFISLTGDKPAGTLAVSPGGDYLMATSAETLKKMVFRVLSTSAGAFAHLPGWGAAPDLKGLGLQSELQRIARDGRSGIRAIPGVVDCSLSVELGDGGVLQINARVQTRRFGVLVFPWSPSQSSE